MKDWAIVGLITVMIVAIVAAVTVGITSRLDEIRDSERKQARCLAAGGMWIDNRDTEGYCFFNK